MVKYVGYDKRVTVEAVTGILLAPITGQLMAELVTDGKSSISLEPFRPDRSFPPGPPPDD